MSARPLLTLLLMLLSTWSLAATEVVPLNYRTSDELLPVARDFIGQDGSVKAYGNQLIVNAEPHKIGELRALLTQLDTAPRRLLISVDTSDNAAQNHNGTSGGRVISYGTSSRDGGMQQIQTSEGSPALIQTGQSIPLTTSRTDSYGYTQSETQYRNVTQGFYVTASVTGDIVHLTISTNRDRLSQERPDAIKVQSTDSTVSGRLGEWITLAGSQDQSIADRQAGTQNYSTQGRDSMLLRVKVETLE